MPNRRRRWPLLDLAGTLTQCCPEVDWPAVLAEEIREGLVGEFLEVPHAIPGEQVEGVPGLLIELNAGQGSASRSLHGGIRGRIRRVSELPG
jgi:hypothetical protein